MPSVLSFSSIFVEKYGQSWSVMVRSQVGLGFYHSPHHIRMGGIFSILYDTWLKGSTFDSKIGVIKSITAKGGMLV
jgi:hypothetical protein